MLDVLGQLSRRKCGTLCGLFKSLWGTQSVPSLRGAGRQQDLCQLISERKFRAAFAKHSGKAEGARTVRGLLEVSHVTAIVQAVFSV